jgi:UDP-2,4-diacetamido-2,4,6-trideoxy-beta-L-altropyranose hydrolase
VADLLILADGGGDIGFGHLMRCLAIKNVWSNGTARLLAKMEGEEPSPDGAETFDWFSDAGKLKQFATTSTLILVDSYRPNADYFRLLKSMFPFVVVLDDYNRILYPVDLVICPGTYGKEMDYSNQIPVTVGGAEYVILRPEILAARQLEIRETIETILVAFGGSQQDEILFQQVIDILEGTGYQAIVVTGNELLAKKLHGKISKIYGRLEPMKMAKIMASVDVAVSAAGQTLNELAWLGVPTFSIRTGIDQQGNWKYYNDHDLSLAAVLCDDVDWESTLKTVLKNETYESRLEQSHRLKNLLTDKGAEKICSLVNQLGSKLDG